MTDDIRQGGNSVRLEPRRPPREYAAELYIGVVAIFALFFLVKRRFTARADRHPGRRRPPRHASGV